MLAQQTIPTQVDRGPIGLSLNKDHPPLISQLLADYGLLN